MARAGVPSFLKTAAQRGARRAWLQEGGGRDFTANRQATRDGASADVAVGTGGSAEMFGGGGTAGSHSEETARHESGAGGSAAAEAGPQSGGRDRAAKWRPAVLTRAGMLENRPAGGRGNSGAAATQYKGAQPEGSDLKSLQKRPLRSGRYGASSR